MTQALYAHVNKKNKNKSGLKVSKYPNETRFVGVPSLVTSVGVLGRN
jgi:hypothetical protein